LKQLALGDRDESKKATMPTTRDFPFGNLDEGKAQLLLKLLYDLFDLIEEIAMGGETDNLAFVMQGVTTLQSILSCVIRVQSFFDANGEQDAAKRKDASAEAEKEHKDVFAMRKKLSGICHRLMQRNWSSSTSFKRGNIGTIVELYIEHSFVPIPSDDSLATKMDATRLGRIATLTNVINDILPQLSNTIACKGPVDAYPTCNYQSFGSFYAVALSFLPKELDFFFDSSFGDHAKSPESAIKLLDVVAHLIDLLDNSFTLIKENPIYVKKLNLLVQLRHGSKFLEVLVKRAVPLLQMNFREHEKRITNIIKQTQCCTKQMHNVILYGKRNKDHNLLNETPRAKKVLETFIHKIKVLMKKNNCLGALWGGHLKNKNIDGSMLEESDSGDEEKSGTTSCEDDNDTESVCSSVDADSV